MTTPEDRFAEYQRVLEKSRIKIDAAGEVAQRFGFHKATIEGPEATQMRHVVVRRAYMAFVTDLMSLLPEGHYRELAIDDLERAAMWTHKAIASTAPLEDLGIETHTEETMHKVYKALLETGMNGDEAREAIQQMQNSGILFRELTH